MSQSRLFNEKGKYDKVNPKDIVFTPRQVAKYIVEWARPKGKCLDPCMGEGVFYNYLPDPKDWCEITKDRNFYDYKESVDWIISNPPYSDFDRFLDHSFEVSKNVVYLVPVAKVFKSWGTINKIRNYGGIVKMWMIPANRCGFPFGFPAMAVHIKQGYKGEAKITYAKE